MYSLNYKVTFCSVCKSIQIILPCTFISLLNKSTCSTVPVPPCTVLFEPILLFPALIIINSAFIIFCSVSMFHFYPLTWNTPLSTWFIPDRLSKVFPKVVIGSRSLFLSVVHIYTSSGTPLEPKGSVPNISSSVPRYVGYLVLHMCEKNCFKFSGGENYGSQTAS